ncbi:ATP-dependent RNA helicase HrpA [Janthinobacterium lividum]|uniref:ATP-dependent RNA helicase HrpA n=1 Tax=Janthinobacterium lividum TaxID=29581 RepID=UPI0008758430|nr:ATP-dependent RNA helicase HrpA [Janthinobacterium lividum]MCC7714193.1 ATP-dependent RNA helicase HrpA [Janthinobacterium lividum]OEZ47024.1 ATP-dependent RNA helicase HrpB [Janthinobacterium lividum]WQE27879.1 ATP-dependent RNA helicase HrpA [Janthinobacterium lividum]STQ98800.1 ATP-dependent RNA helicase HrpA [Janthinobacterium lividum]
MSSASNKSSPPSNVANVPASGDVSAPAATPAQGRQRPPVSQQRQQPPRAEQQKQQQQQRSGEGKPQAARPPREGQESREARDAARAAREAEKAFRNPLPPITYPEDLPVSGRRAEIAKALMENQVIIVSGETGSGKTTQLPKICLELGRGQKGMIGHTQPRRIAASSTAKRIAQELGTPLGETVGFKVRFTDTLSRGASVKLMTDGILLAETQTDPLLKNYDTIIIDEAHERSLNIDFLLGYLKQLLPRRPDLKIIITSATIDAERFSRHFGTPEKPAPVIEVSGRLYQVEVRYRPVEREQVAMPGSGANTDKPGQRTAAAREKRDLMDAVVDGVEELCRIGSGDVLVFLPGEREIRDCAEALRKHHPPHVEILPLFARLSAEEQERVFKTSNARRIVLATNVAETSLTVPGIRYVVDAGLARVKRYSYRNKVEQLQVEPIAQSAANQRAGRCGRVADGVCIRLYEEQDYLLRPKFTEPEILRSSLAAVILRMKSLHLTDVETFPFIEPPLARAVADGYQLLQELGAVDEVNKLTPLGNKLAKLPLDPRVGRMILAALDNACLTEVLIVASALSVQDPRDRPMEHQQAADEAHKKFADEKSEFLSYLKIWRWFESAIEHKKTNRQLQDNCRTNFLSQMRLREWRDVHSQLLTIVKEQGWRLNEAPATYDNLHMALLTGLLGNIGFKGEDEPGAGYLGARGIKFHIWPGSSLLKKPGKWIMAAELVDTTRLYARCVAQIQPEWLEKVGVHLLKKSWGEPRWEKRSAQVTASERATLYGLVVYSQRRINYGNFNLPEAREIFIRDALVGGDFDTRAPFFAHNHKLIKDIENLEHKSRRLDVLVDDELIAAFYDKLLPADVCNGAGFEKWHKEATRENPKLLYLNREELMRHEAAGVTTDLFPKTMSVTGLEMGLTYHFEPGSVRDGVTLSVPLYALNQLPRERCEWLVPGMLKEKVHLLLKSLPQKLRRHCVPLPDYAAKFCERVHEAGVFGRGDLIDAIILDIRTQITINVLTTDFKPETLPAHHFMNFKVIDEHGRQLDMGRNLATLQAEFGGQARQSFQKLAEVSGVAGTGTPGAKVAGAQVASRLQAQAQGAAANAAAGKGGAPAKGVAAAAAPASPNATVSQHMGLTGWTFGELPELLEIVQGKLTLIGFPALVDKGTHCDLEVFDDPTVAARTHKVGLRRLFALQMKEQIKYVEKSIPGLQQMGMQFMALGSQEELREQIINKALDIACLQDPLPLDAASFAKRQAEGKSRLVLLVNEIARLLSQVLTEFHGLPKRLQNIPAAAAADIQSQLQGLVHKRFLTENEYTQLAHFPRYLKAINVRLEKLRADPARDTKLMAEWQSAAAPYLRQAKDRQAGKNTDPKLVDFRWMLEELRVSLFAQELRTPMPVSAKRLQKVWESMQR